MFGVDDAGLTGLFPLLEGDNCIHVELHKKPMRKRSKCFGFKVAIREYPLTPQDSLSRKVLLNVYLSASKVSGVTRNLALWPSPLPFTGPRPGPPHSVPTILPVIERGERDPKADHIRGSTPLTGAEKSRAWLRHGIAMYCSPGCLRAGLIPSRVSQSGINGHSPQAGPSIYSVSPRCARP